LLHEPGLTALADGFFVPWWENIQDNSQVYQTEQLKDLQKHLYRLEIFLLWRLVQWKPGQSNSNVGVVESNHFSGYINCRLAVSRTDTLLPEEDNRLVGRYSGITVVEGNLLWTLSWLLATGVGHGPATA